MSFLYYFTLGIFISPFPRKMMDIIANKFASNYMDQIDNIKMENKTGIAVSLMKSTIQGLSSSRNNMSSPISESHNIPIVNLNTLLFLALCISIL